MIVACLANLSVAAAGLSRAGRPITIVSAGTDGEPALEDSVAAGGLVARLLADPGHNWILDDPAKLCLAAFRQVDGRLADALRDSDGGRNVAEIGLGEDLAGCTAVDSLPVLPVVQRDPLCITVG